MATDIDLKLERENDLYDLQLNENGDFKLVQGFDTSLAVSLFGERRANASEVPTSEFRRGWWGNEVNEAAFELGSKLWIVMQQPRKTSTNRKRAEAYAREGLQWLIDDGFVKDIKITSQFSETGILLEIKLLRDQDEVDTKYFELWENSGELT